MQPHHRWRWAVVFGAGLLLGQAFGPAVAWAADRLEVNLPSVFRIEAYRTLPVQVERPVEIRADRYGLPQIHVAVDALPPLKLEGGAKALAGPTFQPLRETPEATVFVAHRPDGSCRLLRWDHASGKVEPVGEFDL